MYLTELWLPVIGIKCWKIRANNGATACVNDRYKYIYFHLKSHEFFFITQAGGLIGKMRQIMGKSQNKLKLKKKCEKKRICQGKCKKFFELPM